MKKLFLVLFFITSFCPFVFAEINHTLVDDNTLKEITADLNQALLQDPGTPDFSKKAKPDELFYVMFKRTSVVESDNERKTLEHKSSCLAIALHENWLLLSGHCFWDESIQETGIEDFKHLGKILSVKYDNFYANIDNKFVKVIPHKLSNLYLLQIDNNEHKIKNVRFPNILVSSQKDKKALINSLSEGQMTVESTFPTDFFGPWDENAVNKESYSYYIHANIVNFKIKDILIDNRNDIKKAVGKSFFKPRAGDPLFYQEKGKEFIAGFSDALNIHDSSSQQALRRTNKITLFSSTDHNEIISTIEKIDENTAKEISKNTVFK